MAKLEKSETAWVLTSEHNDYDQHGDYFEAVFESMPSIEDLAKWFGLDDKNNGFANAMLALNFLIHIRNGGGRQGTEHSWYNLNEVEFGKRHSD